MSGGPRDNLFAPVPDPNPGEERFKGGYGDARTGSGVRLTLPPSVREELRERGSESGSIHGGVRSELNEDASERSIRAIPL